MNMAITLHLRACPPGSLQILLDFRINQLLDLRIAGWRSAKLCGWEDAGRNQGSWPMPMRDERIAWSGMKMPPWKGA